ncbi:hypothetical protein FDU21_11715 [Xanthomonas oryzae pv. oryzae]|nr:hypothetical protein FDU21_11715 [Xanthomonas oryzae pv. oryzae]
MRTRDEWLVAAIGRRHAAAFVTETITRAAVAAVAEPVASIALLVLALLILTLTLSALTLLVLAGVLVLALCLGLSLLALPLALSLILVLLLLRLVEALLLRLAALAGLAVGVATVVGAGRRTGVCAIAGRLRRCRVGSARRCLRGTGCFGCGLAGKGRLGCCAPPSSSVTAVLLTRGLRTRSTGASTLLPVSEEG